MTAGSPAAHRFCFRIHFAPTGDGSVWNEMTRMTDAHGARHALGRAPTQSKTENPKSKI